MAIKEIVTMGAKSLRTPSLPVRFEEFNSPQLYSLIEDMRETMHFAKGIGIAAPQIGINKKVIMIEVNNSDRYPGLKPIPYMVLINPEINFLTEEKIFIWEGCLSVPGLRGKVPRYKKLHFKGFNPEGDVVEGIAENFFARIIQHECDHINGKLYIHSIQNMDEFGFDCNVLEHALDENRRIIENSPDA